uniref:Uncharacterized protein n=1 Tax=Cucumis melo TaxID=3656 RepID=A0A9I9EGW3_CUCME
MERKFSAFSWNLAPSLYTIDWIKLWFLDYPVKGHKANLWISFICVVLSKIWEERNGCIIKSRAKPTKDNLESSIFIAF